MVSMATSTPSQHTRPPSPPASRPTSLTNWRLDMTARLASRLATTDRVGAATSDWWLLIELSEFVLCGRCPMRGVASGLNAAGALDGRPAPEKSLMPQSLSARKAKVGSYVRQSFPTESTPSLPDFNFNFHGSPLRLCPSWYFVSQESGRAGGSSSSSQAFPTWSGGWAPSPGAGE